MKKKKQKQYLPNWEDPSIGSEGTRYKSWILKRGTHWVGEGTYCTKKNLTKLYLVGKAPMSGPY
jgi:hypothetical protein